MPILNKCFSFLAGLHLAIFSLSTFNMLRDGLMLTQQRDIRPVHCEIRIPKAKRRIGTSRVRHQHSNITRLVTRSVTQVALCNALQVPLYYVIRNIGRYQVRNPVV